jgi:hypothetical protein
MMAMFCYIAGSLFFNTGLRDLGRDKVAAGIVALFAGVVMLIICILLSANIFIPYAK